MITALSLAAMDVRVGVNKTQQQGQGQDHKVGAKKEDLTTRKVPKKEPRDGGNQEATRSQV